MSRKVVPLGIIASLILVLLFSFGTAISYPIMELGSDATEAQEAINEAQDAIYSALGYITEADLAGVPISDFVTSLNEAIETLAQARAAYNASDFTSATQLAGVAENAAETVSQQAQVRLIETRTNAAIQTLITLIILIVVIAATYLLITKWHEYKRKQEQSLQKMEIRLPTEEEEGETDE